MKSEDKKGMHIYVSIALDTYNKLISIQLLAFMFRQQQFFNHYYSQFDGQIPIPLVMYLHALIQHSETSRETILATETTIHN